MRRPKASIPPPPKPWRATARALLLAGAGGLALSATAVRAQEAPALRGRIGPTPVAAPTPAPVQAAASSDVYIEADTLTDNQETNTVTAEGSVEARHQGRVIRADQLVYHTDTGAAEAHGHVVMVNPDGTTDYADDADLDDQMRAGLALGFSSQLLTNPANPTAGANVTLTGVTAVRKSETVNELTSATYTPCALCNPDGTAKNPTFSIQASKIVEDREHKVIYYRNAVIRVKGVPIFYAPVFWHPDPTVDRASGLLAPRFQYSNRRGFSYEQPYLWAISPYADLVVSPQLNTNVNPFLNLDYRERFNSGQLDLRLGYTYDQNFDSSGKFGNATSRSYVLANGLFKLTPNWTWGFGLENVSDPTLFARYAINGIYDTRGLFTTDTLRLLSQLYTTRQDGNSYFSAAALSFQSLRVSEIDRVIYSADSNDVFPVAAPLVEDRYDFSRPILGGRLRVTGDAVALNRDGLIASALAPSLPALVSPASEQPGVNYLQYSDSRRASADFDWRSSYTLANGMQISPFLLGRTDAYSITDPTFVDVSLSGAKTVTTTAHTSSFRGSGSLGADFSWPFIRQFGDVSVVLEPLAQAIIAPTFRPNPNIPNEDSLAFEFDDTNLFSTNRFPGYDLYEGGDRFNLGGRVSVDWGGGGHGSFMIGRSYRTEPEENFPVGSGLETRASDWVTYADVTPLPDLTVYSRSRFDSMDFSLKREEAGLNLSLPQLTGTLRYLYDTVNLDGTKTHSIQAGIVAWVTKNWGLGVNASRDLEQGVWPAAQFSLIYQDDCIRVDLIYTHDGTYSPSIAPSNSVTIRLSLATLGGTGSRNNAR